RCGDGPALRLVAAGRADGLRADTEELHRDPVGAVEDPQRGDAAGPVALPGEGGLDRRAELGRGRDAALELFRIDAAGRRAHSGDGGERDGAEEGEEQAAGEAAAVE